MASEIHHQNNEKSDEDLPTKFVMDPSPHLKCPVCQRLYKDPVINIKCGHTFCRRCAFITTHCPVDQSHCDTSQIVVNRLVVGQIEDLQIYCRHGIEQSEGNKWELVPDSCSQVVTLGGRQSHEDVCVFALVSCPLSARCTKMRRKDLPHHKLHCTQVECVYAKNGCTFRGTQKVVENHSKVCLYKAGVPSSNHLATKLAEHEATITALRENNVQLSMRVTELEDSRLEMKTQMEKQEILLQQMQRKVDSLLSSIDLVPAVSSKRLMSGSQISLSDSGVQSRQHSTSSTPSTPRSGSPGRNYEKWEMPFQFKCIGTLRGHKDVVWAMTTRKGRLYSGGADGIIKIWSLEQLAKGCVGNITAHTGVIHCLATSGNTLVSAGADKSIAFWDLDSSTLASRISEAHENIVCSMIVCNNVMFTSSFDEIKVWDLKTYELQVCHEAMNHWVRALAVNRGKDRLYSGSHNAINVWETKDKFDKLATIELESGSVYSLAISKTYVIAGTSGSYDKNIQLFNLETHEFVMNFNGHIGTVTTLVVSPSGQFLFSASHDSTIQMWGLEVLLPIQNLSRHQGSVNTLSLHGDFLLSGSEDHEIKVFRYFRMLRQ